MTSRSLTSSQSVKRELDECRLKLHRVAAELSNNEATYAASVDAMKRLATERGMDAAERIEVVAEVNEKWQKEMELFQKQTANEIRRMRQEYESKTEEVEEKAVEASQEWHKVDFDLKNSKEEVLAQHQNFQILSLRFITQ